MAFVSRKPIVCSSAWDFGAMSLTIRCVLRENETSAAP
jgi:hypothetical protein